jgi:hypothetical protein
MATSEYFLSRKLETERVAVWRLDQFLALGFSDVDAWDLAASGADLHLIRSLIASHCPHELAMRIVR